MAVLPLAPGGGCWHWRDPPPAAWDFVVIDECLAVQNDVALQCAAAWRQVEMSACGVMMLSATFFRSRFSSLFYMIRMLRSPLPRTMEWLKSVHFYRLVASPSCQPRLGQRRRTKKVP